MNGLYKLPPMSPGGKGGGLYISSVTIFENISMGRLGAVWPVMESGAGFRYS